MVFWQKRSNLVQESDFKLHKMKKIFQILILVLTISCSKPSDCIESTGAIITKTVEVGSFTQIRFYTGIGVVLTQGATPKVEIKTGENLMSNISVTVNSDGVLILKDNTSCNWVREYGQTVVYVTAPNITDIVSKSEKNISSNGVLAYPYLRLEAMDLSDGAGTGDFDLQINSINFTIENNNVANYHISGQTVNFNANLYEGNGRIEAQNLIAQNIKVFHRGSNDMILFPVISLTGNLYSTGNAICKNYPTSTPTVTAYYRGQLIFN
jgi:DNA-binding protein